MGISIITIVKNDYRIQKTLEHLEGIKTNHQYEIIVVDASPVNLLEDIKNNFRNVNWIYYTKKPNKKTYPEQRNIGIENAKGEIIIFIDADCIPDEVWLDEIIKPIIEQGELIVAGSVESIGGRSFWDVEQESIQLKEYINECSTINMAFMKSIIKKVGFFDETFEAGEDTDFSWRAVDSGYKIKYNKNAIVHHDWGDLQHQIKRAISYGEARVGLYAKHSNRLSNLLYKDNATLLYPLYLLFLPISIIFPYYLLLIIIPILKDIRKSPFKTFFFQILFGFGVLKGLIFSLKKLLLRKHNFDEKNTR
jgi:GT2 family glycosyltransferase